MIDQFINFVIRPPRAEYNPDQYLWETEFTLAGRQYKRQDLELTNSRGHKLRCSHYLPSPLPEDTPLPCVIYCHGNSGCRADANEAALILLPSNITVFTLDFSGSGFSDGDYVSLGWHERDDLKIVVSYLRSNKQISCIGLWGRSMGAVTSLFYGAEDPSIAGMVLDSAFSNLFDLMVELVDVYKIRLPKFTDFVLNEDSRLNSDKSTWLQDKPDGPSEECFSYSSSNRESWGRCFSLGGSDEGSSAECTAPNNRHQMSLNVLATPLRSAQQESADPPKEGEKKKKDRTVSKKSKRDKFEKLDALSQRLRLCILKRVNHRRHHSS